MAGPQPSPLLMLGQAAASIQAVVDQIRRIPDAVRGFVDAFSPQTGERLDYAFRSLYATVGYALEPVLTTATRIVEGFADAVSGGMNELREPVGKVAGLFEGALAPALAGVSNVMGALARTAGALSPLFEPLAGVLEGVAAIGGVVATIAGELTVAAADAFVKSLSDAATMTDFLKEQFVALAAGVIHVTDFLLRLAGHGALANKMLEALAKDPEAGGRRAGAPQGFQSGGLEDVYRRRLVEAARGGGGKPAEERNLDLLGDIRDIARKMLEELQKDPGAALARRDKAIGGGVRDTLDRAAPGALALARQADRNGMLFGPLGLIGQDANLLATMQQLGLLPQGGW